MLINVMSVFCLVSVICTISSGTQSLFLYETEYYMLMPESCSLSELTKQTTPSYTKEVTGSYCSISGGRMPLHSLRSWMLISWVVYLGWYSWISFDIDSVSYKNDLLSLWNWKAVRIYYGHHSVLYISTTQVPQHAIHAHHCCCNGPSVIQDWGPEASLSPDLERTWMCSTILYMFT